MYPLADMVLNGSVEHIFMYLDRHKPGSPLPEGLFKDINPYQHRPSHLPVGILYLVNSTVKKENVFGIWEVKEEASEIFTNSSIIGLRTTLQFLDYQDSLECRTNWVMHEYKIILKKLSAVNKEKEARAICKVFLSEAWSSNTEKHDKSKGCSKVGRNMMHTMASVFPRTESYSKQGSSSRSVGKKGVDQMQLLSEAEKGLYPLLRDISEHHHMLNGDYLEFNDLADPASKFCYYLELNDLAKPLSRSSSSDNSSLYSLISDEYFDPNTLLQELEENNSKGQQGKSASSKFSIMSSVRPFEVVVKPASSGSLASSTERKTPRTESLASAACNTTPPISEEKKKPAFLKGNRLKHFCFMLFESVR